MPGVAPTPAIPTFGDGILVHQTDLNALGANIKALYTSNLGGFRTTNPCVEVRTTVARSIATTTEVPITFDVADINTDNMWTAGAPATLVVNTPGVYLITCVLGLSGSSPYEIAARILVNGTNSPTDGQVTSSASALRNVATVLTTLGAGAVINATIFQRSGSTQTLVTTLGACRLSAFHVST